MKEDTEYQIYIGCYDAQQHEETVSVDELREMVMRFFRQKKINFTIYSSKGGYIYDDGRFISENTLCIDLIGAGDLDIIKLAKALSTYMNQECSLVIKEPVKAKYY